MPSARVLLALAAALATPLLGCGGGGSPEQGGSVTFEATPPTTGGSGGGGGAGGGGGGTTPPAGTAPQVVLLMVNGHAPLAQAASYMDTTVGPYLAGVLQAAGYTVEVTGYVDGTSATNGYAALLAKLRAVRDAWIVGQAAPSRVVLVGHSHGGPWMHGATRDVPDCPVRCLVDLDTNSYQWNLAHTADSAALGGSPENAYTINVNVAAPAYPAIASEAGFLYDLDDVIFPSVRDALECVTGDVVFDATSPTLVSRYDERWNCRLDGTQGGLAQYYSGTLHTEPVTPPAQGGTTLAYVGTWIVGRLAIP